MAITTYAELQTAVANWLVRSDLTSRIPEGIALFEAQLNRELAVRQQITTTNLSPSSGTASLPSDYLEWKRVTYTGSPRVELEYVDPSYLQAAYPDTPSDIPKHFTIEGGNLLVRPVNDTTLQLLYAQKVPALSVSATTNWLLTAYPDVYLYGSAAHVCTLTKDFQTGMAYGALAKAAMDAARLLSISSRGPAMIRAYGSTP